MSERLEPVWLHDMAEGVLGEQARALSLRYPFPIMPIGLGILALAGMLPLKKRPFHIRVWKRLKGWMRYRGAEG